MKSLITILSLLPCLSFGKPSLLVTLKNCSSNTFAEPQNIKVFINGEYSNSLTDSLRGKRFTYLRNLDTGLYKFQYINQFNAEFEKTIHISEEKRYDLILCADNLGDYDETFRGMIDSISAKKPLIIKVKTGGSFSTSDSELKISKRGGKYFAYYSSKQETKDKPVKNTNKFKQLKLNQVNLIRTFEYELSRIDYYNNNSGIVIFSTATSDYTLTCGTSQKIVRVSLSEWKGIWGLVTKLF